MEFVNALAHILGLVLFGGGAIWLATLMARVDSQPSGYGNPCMIALLSRASHFMGIGILLLWASGVGRLLTWGDPGLLFLPRLYGWILLAKILLYLLIVINGILIENRYLPVLTRGAARDLKDGPNEPFIRAWIGLKVVSRWNFLLAMVVVALGESLRFCQA